MQKHCLRSLTTNITQQVGTVATLYTCIREGSSSYLESKVMANRDPIGWCASNAVYAYFCVASSTTLQGVSLTVTLITKWKVTACRWFQNTIPFRMLHNWGVLFPLHHNCSNPKVWGQCLHKTMLCHITLLYFRSDWKLYISNFFFLWRNSLYCAMVSSLARLHHHTNTILSRTPLDEWSTRRRDLYLTTHNTHKV